MLHAAEKCYQEGNGEVHDKSLVDGYKDIIFSGGTDNDGEGSIHGGVLLAKIGVSPYGKTLIRKWDWLKL